MKKRISILSALSYCLFCFRFSYLHAQGSHGNVRFLIERASWNDCFDLDDERGLVWPKFAPEIFFNVEIDDILRSSEDRIIHTSLLGNPFDVNWEFSQGINLFDQQINIAIEQWDTRLHAVRYSKATPDGIDLAWVVRKVQLRGARTALPRKAQLEYLDRNSAYYSSSASCYASIEFATEPHTVVL